MPVQYTSIIEEHQAVRCSAGLFDISHMGRLVFRGPDALELIQLIFTNDAASMKQGQVRYGFVCNGGGGILDDVLVYRFDAVEPEPFWLMVVNASNRDKILEWIQRHLGSRRVEVEDKTLSSAMIALQGPKAFQVLKEELLSNFGAMTFSNAFPVAQLKYYHALAGITEDGFDNWIISRTGYTGEDGLELIMPSKGAISYVDTLTEALKNQGVQLKPCGLGSRDTLRLEASMPLYGHELSEQIDPFQAGLSWAVKLDKGDFLGRAALIKRQENEHLPHRVGLSLDGKRIARENALVTRGGKEVGRVSSGTFAPTLNQAIAMAFLEPESTTPGTSCEVDVRGKTTAARVVKFPFYSRPK